MVSRSFWSTAVALLAMVLLAPLPIAAQSSGPMPITAAVNRTLVGNNAGAVDVYAFTVPPDTAAPTVSVQFTPAQYGDGSRGGFQVSLNGTVLGNGTPVSSTVGLVQYTLPHAPAGTAVIQVFGYQLPEPASYTISTSNVPAGAPNGPAGANKSADKATPINGQSSGTLYPNGGGDFAYYTFPTAGSSPPATVSMTYSPADATVEQAVGFNVFDQYQNNIGSATQPKGNNHPADTITLDLSRTIGESLTLQVFNYAPGIKMTYTVTVSGIPPAIAQPAATPPAVQPASPGPGPTPAAFQPFWVRNFVVTPLWSGPDPKASSFGRQRQFSTFLVVAPQSGSRLYVYNPATHNYAYIDAAAVGPSGPPGT